MQSSTGKHAEIRSILNPEMNQGEPLGKSSDVEQAKSPTEDLRLPVFHDPNALFSSPLELHALPETVTDNLEAVKSQESQIFDLKYRRADGREYHRVMDCSQALVQVGFPDFISSPDGIYARAA